MDIVPRVNTRTRASIACIGLLLVATAGCGSGSSASSKSPSPSVPQAVRTAITDRMKAEDGLYGTPKGKIVVQDAHAFAGGDAKYASQLKKEQMDGGASQHLSAPDTDDAIRAVLHFATAQEASKEAGDTGSADTTFTVPGIPGAVGTEFGKGGDVKGLNVMFTVGDYEYVLGCAPSGGHAPSRATFVKDAKAWYAKVSGKA
jgi:hypothetical protein